MNHQPITKYSGLALKLERIVDLTNAHELSPAQVDEMLGIPRSPEEWERNQASRRKWWAKQRERAWSAVKLAQLRGELSILPARDIRCVDCDDYATRWEHRDYSKPLDVEPICASCNQLRQSAKDAPVFEDRPDPTWLDRPSDREHELDAVLTCCRERSRRYE